jgi:glycosyltransferase involved in cell wall biosynthesis
LADLEVTFLMPCLNEAETIERCVRAAMACIQEHGLAAEVVVADNGSTDGSQGLARGAGARVIDVPTRGVGAAVLAGVRAARGRFIILGDSDLQHDFAACFPFVRTLRGGHWDLVMGSRLTGKIMPGAMRPLNRYIGNPMLSFVGRLLFRAPVSDFHCGLRAFTRESFLALNLRTIGFEFTTEHIVKSCLRKLRITEIPITVYPEGRSRPPHLRRFSDGWRTLRFMLLLSPRWTLAVPGLALMAAGGLLALLVYPGTLWIGKLGLDVHTLVLACMMLVSGFTALSIGAAARIYATQLDIGPPGPVAGRLASFFTLERGAAAGLALLIAGLAMIAILGYRAVTVHLPESELKATLRPMILGATLVALGVQTVLMSFFYSMLSVRAAPSER